MTTRPYSYRRAAGTSLLLAVCGDEGAGVPVMLHWGADLGDLDDEDVAALVRARTPSVPHSALDEPRWASLLPDPTSGFTGTPAVEGMRPCAGAAWAPKFTGWTCDESGSLTVLRAADPEAGLAVACEISLTDEGVVTSEILLTNTGESDFVVGAVRCTLPVGAEATQLLDLTGRWTRERVPQRQSFHHGVWQRAGRHGRTGHDAPLLLAAGTPEFGFRAGTVWAVHLAWSGDHAHYGERTPEGESLLGAQELLGPGEVVLGSGESYRTPQLLGAWSPEGLDGLSRRLHAWTRRHSPRTRSPRPVVVNTWEAVYFDHDLARLTELADAAAEVGAERFVLDDGWFRGRRDDHSGLGDWVVDAGVWPQGLHPLVDHVRGLGLDFGLWVEPEMVNEDSDLARAHPEWLLRGRPSTLPPAWRHQHVVDLQQPDAYDYLRRSLSALVEEYHLDFLKWDHNRDLVDVAHGGRPAVHGQTRALYRLLDELRQRHPRLEIESCASGGGRVDLGVLQRTDRVWASDTIDALERQHIQRWTSLLVPPELIGAHVGGGAAHTTGRVHRLGFRAATALLGHFGLEWDITAASPGERAELREWIALYKQIRHLLVDGTVVRADHPDPALLVSGVVAADEAEAVYVLAAVARSSTQAPAPVRLPGLDPARHYEVRRVASDRGGPVTQLGSSWLDEEPVVLPGSVLAHVGVQLPPVAPESAHVLRVCTV